MALATGLAAALAAASAALFAASATYGLWSREGALRHRRRAVIVRAPVQSDEDRLERLQREELEAQLRQLDERDKGRNRLSLAIRLEQAGVSVSENQFIAICAVTGLLAAVWCHLLMGPIWAAGAALLAGWVGPWIWLRHRTAKRLTMFIAALPDALENIARGVTARQTPSACVEMVARDAREPLKREFQAVVEAQAMGATLVEGFQGMARRVRCDETRYLVLALTLQAENGGTIAETLMKLARTLRRRQEMRDELLALTADQRFSGHIVSMVPIAVVALNYYFRPEGTTLLWTTTPGQIISFGCLIWILIGMYVMRKMADFKV